MRTSLSSAAIDRLGILRSARSDSRTQCHAAPVARPALSPLSPTLSAMTVKPDGTKLFMAWYDRRNDPTNNALIQIYGVFVTLPLPAQIALPRTFWLVPPNFRLSSPAQTRWKERTTQPIPLSSMPVTAAVAEVSLVQTEITWATMTQRFLTIPMSITPGVTNEIPAPITA